MKVGVLALQGAFVEHISIMQRLGAEASPVRLPDELDGLDGLIIPGGESTTMSRLMQDFGLMLPLRELARSGFPLLGTCAGAIMLSEQTNGAEPETLGVMRVRVARNAFGRQVDSFECDLKMSPLGEEPFHAIFIRAPVVENVGAGVEVLARLADGTIVAVRQGKMLACAFHPELSDDLRLHRWFLSNLVDQALPRLGA